MNVLLISQCSKRALTETRRILDQFAERKGERTWQTAITQAGLDTLRKLLRKTARKNTAVACHWIRGRDHSELLWIVGDGRAFNAEGAVPTDTTRRDILRKDGENTWHHLDGMTALTALAALMHDLGKATQAFQQRLQDPACRTRNHYRHEWVSVRLFQAFVGSDDDEGWLTRLADAASQAVDPEAFEVAWLDHASGRLFRDELDEQDKESPVPRPLLANLPPLARAVAWLVLTHHRLPCLPVSKQKGGQSDDPDAIATRWHHFGARASAVRYEVLDGYLHNLGPDWNEPRESRPMADVLPYWTFLKGLPVRQGSWRKQAARYARKLLGQLDLPRHGDVAWCDDPFVMNVSRLGLMLADHHYSSLGVDSNGEAAPERRAFLQPASSWLANTARNDQRRIPNQTLDEHLLGVTAQATLVMRSLPSLVRSLAALRNHRGLKKRTTNVRFQWQDKASDLAASVRQRALSQGAFIVNMASTGCGKTLGNARIMNALSDPALGMRCAFAIGLRTLTLQTGRSFQHDLGLSDDELAIMVGGSASRALFEYWEQRAEESGSSSSQALLDEGGQVLFEGNDEHPLLSRLGADAKTRSLLVAPMLVCTVDHLVSATESLKGGRQIVPMLRLMSSDLVLDEPDDFDMADLPALTRLVYWAGLLGSRVLLSSATLPPALVTGLFMAYQAGRTIWQRNRGDRPSEPVRICCLWVDEFNQEAHECIEPGHVKGRDDGEEGTSLHDGPEGFERTFRSRHDAFVEKRVKALAKAEVRRIAKVSKTPDDWAGMDKAALYQPFAEHVLERALELHQLEQNHLTDPETGRCLSFGLIRMANIRPLFGVAACLYRMKETHADFQIHLCVYHSQFPLLARSALEQQLDKVLNRRGDRHQVDPVLSHPSVRKALKGSNKKHHLFIVLGSPVTEVGRDHDYDWAVVEPSSMRSIIQLAGRVRRHRVGGVTEPNIIILDRNFRSLQLRPGSRKAAYCKPGFELDDEDGKFPFHFKTHDMHQLLKRDMGEKECWVVDATPRIQVKREGLRPRVNLADMEHARMHDAMLPRSADKAYSTPVHRAASLCWTKGAAGWGSGLLPQLQRFRDDPSGHVDMVFLPDDDEEGLILHRVADGPKQWEKLYVSDENRLHRLKEVDVSKEVCPWLPINLIQALRDYASKNDLSLRTAAERFATISLPRRDECWKFHSLLGFTQED